MTQGDELVKMSEKGQLVVPQGVRESANLNPGERFMAFSIDNGVVFKKVEMPKLDQEFATLTKSIEKQFKKNTVTKKTVSEAITWARKKS
ncbi:MAG: hypothetical protein WC916_04245 [Candidatus Woesearchaeota archaeon]